MTQLQIGKLEKFDPEELRRIGPGYAAREKYVVKKVETRERFVVELTREKLARPYLRTWEPIDGEGRRLYEAAVARGHSLAGYDGDAMVAVAIAEPQDWNQSLWVWEFHTEKHYHRQGIGRRMMDELVRGAAAAGLRVIVCETQNTNVPAIDFYRAVGFELEGVDLSYYSNIDKLEGEVAVFMKRKIQPDPE
ncbi:MAG: N-acetyltransferase [Candidatus Zixiibacteriota bacterium]|jgi:ribosomal protein S18 acetylase RimI-like enzyme